MSQLRQPYYILLRYDKSANYLMFQYVNVCLEYAIGIYQRVYHAVNEITRQKQ